MNSTTSNGFTAYAAQAPAKPIGDNHTVASQAVRRRLPDERPSRTQRFNIAGHKGYLTVGLFPDGGVGEIFITMAKEGSTVSGLVNSFAQVVSIALQYGVPLTVLCDKFTGIRFEPSGFTGNQEIPIATSIMDYIFRWLRLRFIDGPESTSSTVVIQPPLTAVLPADEQSGNGQAQVSDGPPCRSCGSLTRRHGACFACTNCGSTTGCG
jgi:ribonucleoside-diphosphate reductase alpha chain